MKFKKGDRVKFLDEQGGGVVSRIVSPTMVEVITSDGFSFPYPVKSLIPVSDNTMEERLFNEDVKDIEDIEISSDEEENTASAFKDDSLIVFPSEKKPENYSAMLTFVPRDQRWLITGELDIYLVNFSDTDIYFVLYRADDKGFRKVVSCEVKAFSRFYITEINRDEIGLWDKIVVQAVLLKDKTSALLAPVDVEVRIRGSRFYRENSYVKSSFMHEKAVVFELFKLLNMPVLHEKGEIQGDDKTAEVISVKNPQRNDAISPHVVSKGVAVVDMHIWKLVDDETSLSNHQKLLTQLDYFNKCLDSALEHGLWKVVFIHGVGTGRLKEEIYEVLDEKEFEHKPASMAEYGVGATEVLLPPSAR